MYLYEQLTERVIGAAIAVHRELGPGFLESIYEEAFAYELSRREISFQRQLPINIGYQSRVVGLHKLDLLVEGKVVVELKAIKQIDEIHIAIALSYLKAAQLKIALILNFAQSTVGVKRISREKSLFNAEDAEFERAQKTKILSPDSEPKDSKR